MTPSPIVFSSSAWLVAWRGGRHALLLPAWVVGMSLMGVGSLARDVGHPLGSAVLSTLLVWAGPAQVIFYGGLAGGGALPALALAVSLSSIRLAPMTVALLPLLRRPGQGMGLQLLLAHYVSVTAWTESLRRLPAMPVEERLPYFLGFANACIVVSMATTAIGYYLAGVLPVPLAAGLLFLTPIFFTVSIAAGARSLTDWLSFGLGFALAPVAAMVVGGGSDLMVTGLVAGTSAFAVDQVRGRRR